MNCHTKREGSSACSFMGFWFLIFIDSRILQNANDAEALQQEVAELKVWIEGRDQWNELEETKKRKKRHDRSDPSCIIK